MGEFARKYLEDRRPVIYYVQPKLFYFPGKKWLIRDQHELQGMVILEPFRLKERLVLYDANGRQLLHALANKIVDVNATFTIKDQANKTILTAHRKFLRSALVHTKWQLTFSGANTGELLETSRSQGLMRRVNPFYKLIQPARYQITKQGKPIAEIKRLQLFGYSRYRLNLSKTATKAAEDIFLLTTLIDLTEN